MSGRQPIAIRSGLPKPLFVPASVDESVFSGHTFEFARSCPKYNGVGEALLGVIVDKICKLLIIKNVGEDNIMKNSFAYKLMVISLCYCIGITNAFAVMKSTQCPYKVIPPLKTLSCCVGCEREGSHGLLDGPGVFEDYNDVSGPVSAHSCERCYCKTCQSPPFLTPVHYFSFRIANCSLLAELNQQIPGSDFTALLFRPPRS
jgi:hypothetical protein